MDSDMVLEKVCILMVLNIKVSMSGGNVKVKENLSLKMEIFMKEILRRM